MKIIVVDTGISKNFKSIRNTISGYSLILNDCSVIKNNDYYDIDGHGTAIVRIIDSIVSDCEIIVIKINTKEKSFQNQRWLITILDFIYHNENPDLINLSCGITRCNFGEKLEKVCNLIYNKGIIIVAAFNNDGVMTYPALFESVIGIDSSINVKNGQFEFYNQTNNIRTGSIIWKLPDISGKEFKEYSGNSFNTAFFTAKIANMLISGISSKDIISQLKKEACFCYNKEDISSKIQNESRLIIHRALIFPFSKEIHAIARNEEMLNYQVEDYCDLRISGKIGLEIGRVLGCSNRKKVIDFDKVEWTNEFDTVIMGHIQLLSSISKRDLLNEVVGKCLLFNKNLYLFDEDIIISRVQFRIIEKQFQSKKLWISRPNKYYNINSDYFGKLYDIVSPVVCVAGTSSNQGKFTVQIALRRVLQKSGYVVMNFGTEPISELMGFEGMYTIGYGAYIPSLGPKNIISCNHSLHEIDKKNPEIIITGLQSRSIPYRANAINGYPIKQIDFLLSCSPDAYILCVNYFDEKDYIFRTIQYLESLFCSKVLIICINDIGQHFKKWYRWFLQLKFLLYYKKKVCFLSDSDMPYKIAKPCIDYFKNRRANNK